MKSRTLIISLMVFMVFLSAMPIGTAGAYFFDGSNPASARDIPVLRHDVIDIIKIVFDFLSPAIGPFLA